MEIVFETGRLIRGKVYALLKRYFQRKKGFGHAGKYQEEGF
jgi:hypothetical protein